MKERVLVICAHSDDQIFGCGGTLIKYAKQGKDIHTIIFSFGESSHPLLLPKYTAEMRVKESQDADEFIGGKGVTFLGIKEAKFDKEIIDRDIVGFIQKQLKEEEITTIFTHSPRDFHPNHRSVYRAVVLAIDKMGWKGDVFAFDIWNLFKVAGSKSPRLFVDISDSFGAKIKALQIFRSQTISFYMLSPTTFIGALLNGLSRGVRYGEVFLKLR